MCPYAWDVPSGVAIHVHDLAEALIALGHDISVLTPGDEDADVPPYVVLAGRAIPVPFNGSIARVQFGPRSASKVRRWLRDGQFDVLHVHSPVSPSLGMLACWSAIGPIVATFHASLNGRSRAMAAGSWILQATLEKVRARIAVSEEARRTIVENLGGDAVLIPNGVDVSRFSDASPLPGWPCPQGGLIFLGRVDEPRKGLPCCSRLFQRSRVSIQASGCSSLGRVTLMSLTNSFRLRFAARSRYWAGLMSTPRHERWRRPICLWPLTRVVRASASCCLKRWRRTHQSWPATWSPFDQCWMMAAADSCSRSEMRPP